jgi:hypothetical protein
MSPLRTKAASLPSLHVEMATLDIPHECRCSWIVVQAGVGWNCRSRLKATNALCGRLREHHEMAAAAARAAAEASVRNPWSTA